MRLKGRLKLIGALIGGCVLGCALTLAAIWGFGPSDVPDVPREIREHMELSDFLELSCSKYVVSDKNFDGKVDFRAYCVLSKKDPSHPYAEVDTDHDGKFDTWVYRDGRREKDTDGDGKPDQTVRLHDGSGTEGNSGEGGY